MPGKALPSKFMCASSIPSAGPSAIRQALADHPTAVVARVERDWEDFHSAAAENGVPIPSNPPFLRRLFQVWGASKFVARSCVARPALLADLLASGDLLRDYGPRTYARRIESACAGARDETELGRLLRHWRLREMVRIAWRDLAGWAGLEEVLRDLSLLAETLIRAALERLYAWQCREWGTPYDRTGRQAQSLVVLAMGKLGGGELNFSSDVDLVFAYPEDGQTRGRRPRHDNETFFLRLGQRLIGLLDTPTAEGRVYRVDMRLRPYGNSGPLVMSFEAMEDYYQSQGREWERYALIKARPITGDPAAQQRLQQMLQPFVYRRYLDYNALAALRDMKAMIEREVARKSLQDDIKIGPGGIREIEFIGQVFQLIRGGQEPPLRQRAILAVLEHLGKAGHLPARAAAELRQAYVFLRRTENRLQERADQQCHRLPEDADTRQCLALAMGFEDWPAFHEALSRHRQRVQAQFDQVFQSPQGESGEQAGGGLADLWRQALEPPQALALLAAAGFTQPEEAWRRLQALKESHACRTLSETGRRRLDRLMPLLLGAVAAAGEPDRTLPRLLDLVEAVARRTTYLALLEENPMALSQLVRLCAASPWIAQLLRDHPLLLDELLDPRSLYAPLAREDLERELAERLAALASENDPEDEEQELEVLRHFKQAQVLRVAAADIMEVLPLMRVSDHLTEIAEVILNQVLHLALRQLARRQQVRQQVWQQAAGRRRRSGELPPEQAAFAIIGYGKLGGIELGYGSDLDLVFLHGEALEPECYFRLGQRIIHILNTHTVGGILYEVDLRLRPSGASGLLVSPIEAFAEYQAREAWTWEHQALVRARFICGDPAVGRRFGEIRHQVLTRRRDPEQLRREVAQMRERMRSELARSGPGRFDLKQDRGGIADIEFIVQYAVLRWACEHPELTRWTNNIRLLDDCARLGLLPAAQARSLSEIYQRYRRELHRLALQEQPAVVDERRFRDSRRRVTAVWERLLGAA